MCHQLPMNIKVYEIGFYDVDEWINVPRDKDGIDSLNYVGSPKYTWCCLLCERANLESHFRTFNYISPVFILMHIFTYRGYLIKHNMDSCYTGFTRQEPPNKL